MARTHQEGLGGDLLLCRKSPPSLEFPPSPEIRTLDSGGSIRHLPNKKITASSFELRANAPEGQKAISYHNMKKPNILNIPLFASMALLALGGALHPAKAGEAETYYKFYSYYHATWEIEEETEGKKKTYTGKCHGSGGGCNIYVDEKETSMWGFDPKTKQWTGVGQLDGGSRFVMAISRPPGPKFEPGMKFTFTGTIWHPDGKIHYVTTTQTCIDADTTRSVMTGTDQDGKAIPKVIRTHKRKK